MVLQLIKAYSKSGVSNGSKKQSDEVLDVSEFYCDTIQGENFTGYPSAFLRLKNCTMNCVWCDTREVWRNGAQYTCDELFVLIEEADLVRKFREGQHLVLTGGSPLMQQERIIKFIGRFIEEYNFKPYIEIENECVIMPDRILIEYTDQWNNSPKLQNSLNHKELRYKPDVISKMASLNNSWFKFVVEHEEEWNEIEEYFLKPGLIRKDQVVLMPLGDSQDKLEKTRITVVEMAINNNVRYTSREHIMLWNKKTGV